LTRTWQRGAKQKHGGQQEKKEEDKKEKKRGERGREREREDHSDRSGVCFQVFFCVEQRS
jgi:hypothetical protein